MGPSPFQNCMVLRKPRWKVYSDVKRSVLRRKIEMRTMMADFFLLWGAARMLFLMNAGNSMDAFLSMLDLEGVDDEPNGVAAVDEGG